MNHKKLKPFAGSYLRAPPLNRYAHPKPPSQPTATLIQAQMSSTVTVSATTLHSILARLEQVEVTSASLKIEIKKLLGVSSSAPVATTVTAPVAPTAAPVAPATTKAAKAPAKKRGPSRWNRYVSYLTETLTAADPDYKKTPFAERVEQAKSLKDDADEGMGPTNLAFEAWLAAHPIAPTEVATEVASDGASSDSGTASAASDASKKRGRPKGTKMTDEQKAKAAATRAANKAAKATATGGAGAPSAEAESDEADLTPFVVGTTTYYRIASGHSWITSGDDMVYVGLYNETTKTFDKSVADPTA